MDKISKEEVIERMVNEMPFPSHKELHPYIKEAMSIWAEQQSIAFVEWASSHQWQFLSWGGDKGKGWHQGTTYSVPPITTEQLYKTFIEQQVK